jgi:hypothetical protein
MCVSFIRPCAYFGAIQVQSTSEYQNPKFEPFLMVPVFKLFGFQMVSFIVLKWFKHYIRFSNGFNKIAAKSGPVL